VLDSKADPYDQGAGVQLTGIRLRETFSGDIEGNSTVHALQALRDDRAPWLVSLQRVLADGELVGVFEAPARPWDEASSIAPAGGLEVRGPSAVRRRNTRPSSEVVAASPVWSPAI